eukprot:TRINITY_DN10548_c0_g1_i2.p1 TRINITY_DN10548_c0_g1~~TRINITY_DN10548_c0_g1_i2.p1  ORF type:complete len:160 (-),score=63.17 TRINITY_DN10548_c0_g1_i2:116-595(-)
MCIRDRYMGVVMEDDDLDRSKPKHDQRENREEDKMSSENLNSGNMQEIERERYFLNIMTPLQKDRYDNYRAAKIPRAKVEKIVQAILGSNAMLDKKISTLIAGLAKVYAGELVEEAKLIQQEEEDTGKIKPHQLAKARQRALKKGTLKLHKSKPLFRRR